MTLSHLLPILSLFTVFWFAGCQTHLQDRTTYAARSGTQVPLEPPQAGKILVFVSGDTRCKGPLWIPQDANIMTLEEVCRAGDQGGVVLEPKAVIIHREVDGRMLETFYDLKRRTHQEKQAIHLKHGDIVVFPWTNCWL